MKDGCILGRVFFLFALWNRILSMKNYFYRSLAHLKHNPNIHITEQTPNKMNQLLDQKLHYINRSFKHNLQIQQIFLDIIKTKKTLHSKQIKQYYQLFTQNKADSEIFHNTLQDSTRENIESFLHIPDARCSLKRLYCRLIQKMMVKLSFYMTNKQKLSFMYNEVQQMMKKCETLMRRLNYMRDLHSINELIQEIYRQNEDMQIKIIQELIDKGFIISIDQFYRINGVDLVDKQLYERIYSDLGYDEEEEPREEEIIQKLKSIKKFEFNINKKSSFQRMIKEEVGSKKKDKKAVHRTGYIEIQNKYRDLLVHLQNLINNDLIDQIVEEKQSKRSSDSEIRQSGERQSIVGSVCGEIQLQTILQTDKQQKNLENTQQFKNQNQVIPVSQNNQKSGLKQQRPLHSKKYTKIPSIQSNAKESSYCKSEFRQKDINLSNLQSNSHISDIMNNRGVRPNSLKKYTGYFSKSFMSAIKTMQKVNLNDKTNRLAIKRMSEHIFSIHKQSEQSSNPDSYRSGNGVSTGSVLRRNNEKKSIINLINIYQSRKLQEQMLSMQKQFDGYRDKIIKKDETLISPRQKQNKRSLFYQNKKQLNEMNHQKTITNLTNIPNYPKILDKKDSYKDNFSIKISKYQMNSIFKFIPKNLKMQQQLQEEFMKNIEALKAKIKLNTINRIPYFQNARLNHGIQGYEYQLHSATSSPGKNRKNKMQPNSVLTTKGIETIDYEQFRSLICDKTDKIKMCKTAFVSPTNQPSSKMVRFEVYDRKRRVILR